MAITDRKRSNNWRFADTGSRFDTSSRGSNRDRLPIATTFSRRIIRCNRCGSRVVSNAKRCPYCGKSLLPFYKTFVFWLLIVALLATGSAYFIFFYNPLPEPVANEGSKDPIAYGLANRTDTSNLPVGTTVECNDLLITVVSIHQPYSTNDGRLIYEVTVQIVNKSSSNQRLLTTQWVMRTVSGSYEECYTGMTDNGTSLTSGLEGRQLQPDEVLTTRIYFAADHPVSLVYLVNPLETEGGPEVSWLLE